jgi:hypothetical protein
MAEYDNNNRAAGWLRESKTGNKYISLMLNVEGKEYTLALFKNEVEEGSKRPVYTGKITPKGEYAPSGPAVEGEEDVPF